MARQALAARTPEVIPVTNWEYQITYASENNLPFCNLYVGQELARQGIYFPMVSANRQRGYLESSNQWIDIGRDHQRAYDLASSGTIVIVSYADDRVAHGHIGFVVGNEPMVNSSGWSNREGTSIRVPVIIGYRGGIVEAVGLNYHISGRVVDGQSKKDRTRYFYYSR